MKILIPPAKQMKERKEVLRKGINENTEKILEEILKIEDLSKFFKIKSEQAEIERKRFLDIKNKVSKEYRAIELYDGLMYRNIKRDNLSEKEKEYLNNVYITSSFYGIINALDNISLHRLDFLNNLSVNGVSLKKFWQKQYDDMVKNEELIISLLSSEFEEVFSKEIRDRMYKIVFKESGKIHSTISKKARGQFLTALIENNIQSIEEIEKLKFCGYEMVEKRDKIIFFEKNK
ncbi:peroxide stress protein YaaA [Streptobacillus moniliformis]|uniref:peroxide stress protein YaaA n=1 Tax=Streptobacillus moniliformis TaxID=34105 RepID=UPI0007E392C1|nr:peroxide stress protein YaaA [Streptobacillus moniliformis]